MSSFSELYILRALTNLHAGSGDTGYGHVDKMVQRDPLDGLPTIFSSSLKGAFRELLENTFEPTTDVVNGKATLTDHAVIEHIFGTGVKATREGDKADEPRHQGRYRFHQASLLSLPVRSNAKPFYRASTPHIARELIEKASLMGMAFDEEQKAALEWMGNKQIEEGSPLIFSMGEEPTSQIWLEDFEAVGGTKFDHIESLEGIFGKNLALFNHADLKKISQSLPVIARNYLENGISQNLWYEEIVPRESRFYFVLQGEIKDQQTSFGKAMKEDINPPMQVQVGANATVGYGLCQLIPLIQHS